MNLDIGELTKTRDAALLPGVAVGVIVGDQTYLSCVGVTNIEHPLPVTADTLFQVGSVTKSVTAATALVVLERAGVHRSSLVGPLLPDVDFGRAADSLTVEHLLTHTGGWQGDWALMNPPPSRDHGALAELVSRAAEVPRILPPGTAFSYDNFGWCVLGRVVETVADKPFDEAVKDAVLAPLGMSKTLFAAEDAISHRVCAGHDLDDALQRAVVVRAREPWADQWSMRRCLWPTGGLITTLDDALRWVRFHLSAADDGLVGPAPLSLAERGLMSEAVVESGGQGVQAGRGWHIRYASDLKVFGHAGLSQGFNAQVLLVPDRRSALVVLTNSAASAAWLHGVVSWYLEDALGLSPESSPEFCEPPIPPSSLEGEYETVTRRIVLSDSTSDTIRARVIDTGPTWAEDTSWTLGFAEAKRLVALEDSSLLMEYGLAEGSNWLRYRGRVHVLAASQTREQA